jgi:hypothetical protein
MSTFESLSHSRWDCKYHVVFVPKCRKKALYGKIFNDNYSDFVLPHLEILPSDSCRCRRKSSQYSHIAPFQSSRSRSVSLVHILDGPSKAASEWWPFIPQAGEPPCHRSVLYQQGLFLSLHKPLLRCISGRYLP